MSQIRVSIFSDDPFFREGLRQIVHSEPAFTVVDGDPPVRDGIRPGAADVLLVDSRTEGVLDHCAGLKADPPFLIFVSVPNDGWAVDALAAGARGIVRKEDAITDVVRAIRVVVGGGVWAPRRVVVDAWLQRRGGVPDARSSAIEQRLSARECEVARCVAAGMSNKELADRLHISPATVKAHLTHIFQKVGVQGRGELTAAYHGTLTADAQRKSATRLRRPA